jgi:hypothetical protein
VQLLRFKVAIDKAMESVERLQALTAVYLLIDDIISKARQSNADYEFIASQLRSLEQMEALTDPKTENSEGLYQNEMAILAAKLKDKETLLLPKTTQRMAYYTAVDSDASSMDQAAGLPLKFKNLIIETCMEAAKLLQTRKINAETKTKAIVELLGTIINEIIKLCPTIITDRMATSLEEETKLSPVRLLASGGMGWIFLAGDGSERAIIKIPQHFIGQKIVELYRQEIAFHEFMEDNKLADKPWFTEYISDGFVKVGFESYEYMIMPFYRGPQRKLNERMTDQVMTLEEALPRLQQLPPVFALMIVETTLKAVIDLQSMINGFIHRDIKPSNIFLPLKVAQILHDIPELPTDNVSPGHSDIRAAYEELRKVDVKAILSDFGAILEMKPGFLSDAVTDEYGEKLQVMTAAYANEIGLRIHGAIAHSDRFAVAAILFEIITRVPACRSFDAGKKEFVAPRSIISPAKKDALEIALAVLNDPRENHPHTDCETEKEITLTFAAAVSHYIEQYQIVHGRALMARLKRTGKSVTTAFKRKLTQGFSRESLLDDDKSST